MRKRPLTTIILLAVVLRCGLFATGLRSPSGLFTPDSSDYADLSSSLVTSGTFERDGKSEIFRTPGYPFFLIPFWLLGEYWWVGAVLVQIFLDVVLVYLTYLLGFALCGHRVGIWGAVFQGISAVAIVSSVRILSDGLFAFLLMLVILLVIHHLRTLRLWSLVGAGVILSAACYVRPVGLGFAVLLFVVLLCRKGRIRRAGLAAIIVIVAVFPWVLRNGLVGGYWGFSSLPAQVGFDYQGPVVLSEREGISLLQGRGRLRERLSERIGDRSLSPGEFAKTKWRVAMEVVRGDIPTYLKAHARGGLAVWIPAATDVLEVAGVTCGGRGTLDVLRRQGPLSAVKRYFGDKMWAIVPALAIAGLLAAKYLFVLVAVGRYVRPRMNAERWLILLTVVLFTLIPGPAGHPRFRIPVEPLLSVAAAAGWVWILELRDRCKRSGRTRA